MSMISDNWSYARAKLDSGLTYAACAHATGINENTLREALPGYAPAPRPAPAMAVNNFAKGRAAIMSASAHDLAKMLDMAFNRLATISPRFAADFLAGTEPAALLSPPAEKRPVPVPMTKERLWRVVDEVAASHGLTRAEMLTDCREAKYAHARQEAFWSLRQLDPRPSFPAIGRLVNRDHSTVLYGALAHERRMRAEA